MSASVTEFPAMARPIVDARPVVTCGGCSLVQFRTQSGNCRRCRRLLDEPEQEGTQDPPVIAEQERREQRQIPVGADWGAAIRVLRQARGMSQAELGVAANLSEDLIWALENNKRRPGVDTYRWLAKALNVPMTVLIALATAPMVSE